ncbi:ApaLI-like restriction endonuclease [Moorena producens 3L]|uniref:ApaLI-like restriction endonuclease n=2 Tax=Coleofasciculaceae TaxID=1892251 RepID=F4XNT5_9CYAN|nr:ApaLI-like restriction endonuclease [Moorena producens 3L]NEP68021.1 restriction endonuclease [Moorena sp. SIO3A5]OLT69104.1 restriction endonuclease [Moorena producens 3L]
MHGSGEAQVIISDGELSSLLSIAIDNLGWSHDHLQIIKVNVPDDDYYNIPISWFDSIAESDIRAEDVISALTACFNQDNDFALFIENLSALHRRRVKYQRILSSQPMSNMDQIGPRSLLEYGGCNTTLLANWMVWRKWIYDIDNRSAQETGYLFEPLLASCLGGKPVGAKNSPVKRLDANGNPTNQGRQIDCLVPSNNRTYELKLRVTIAASGQGRFGEELSFAEESQAAGFIPVLLVLDPTPSNRLTELSEKYLACGGAFYHGEEAWRHMEQEAGEVVSVFIERYIKPAIQGIEEIEIEYPKSINLRWSDQVIEISDDSSSYVINRL